ncbi:hypothetical protein PENCOP_c004G00625 [Penicillium coprophilum]|uniref:Uncharacterized protein n=1 Tax=Penicillium coprophilum TaxID=36646 RepID=A0A1V6UU25_9EURO|nr:hypothetical protein PENCOP_c004G00625 [Penicillium coprophilum]
MPNRAITALISGYSSEALVSLFYNLITGWDGQFGTLDCCYLKLSLLDTDSYVAFSAFTPPHMLNALCDSKTEGLFDEGKPLGVSTALKLIAPWLSIRLIQTTALH